LTGWTASSIAEEKQYNPRLAGKTESEYIAIMNSLNLPNPKIMDIAVPANLACGKKY
jgi:sulfur dioxygenase